jgi:Tetratricopeptide repeat
MRTILISIFLLLNFTSIVAQNLSQEQVDKQTYDSFFSKDYKTTIQVGNDALKQGIDFYFLRYRLGVSYYENKNFEKAITHFEKAKSLDANDPVLLEYLYYSYVFASRNEQASILAGTFSEELKTKIKYKPTLFKSVSLETGMLFTDNFNKFKNQDLKGNTTSGRGTFYSDVLFGNIQVNNQFSPKFKLQNIFSYVTNTSNYINQVTVPNTRNDIFTDKNNYFQWNAIASYFKKNWTISGGFGYYNSSYVDYTSPIRRGFPPRPLTPTTIKTSNFSGSVSLSKRFKYIEPSLGVSYTDLQSSNTITTEASLTYYPFGNTKFYGNSKFGMVSNSTDNNSIFTQLLGVQISKKIWLEGFGAFGNHKNYISDNGLQVFNTPNQINWYAGSNLNFYLRKIDFSLGYGIQERESSYFSGQNEIKYNYNYNLIKTKIVWKF